VHIFRVNMCMLGRRKCQDFSTENSIPANYDRCPLLFVFIEKYDPVSVI